MIKVTIISTTRKSKWIMIKVTDMSTTRKSKWIFKEYKVGLKLILMI